MTELRPTELTLCYDGTLEGYLSLVFDAYALHARPQAIACTGSVQLALGQQLREVACAPAHAERVRVGICNHAGFAAYRKVEHAFLSWAPERELTLLDYIAGCMAEGRRFTADISNAIVSQVEKLALRTSNEAEHMRQFLRFEQLENGVYFSTINPKALVLPLVMPYFAARFNTQPFLIHDEVHRLCGVYDLRHHYLVSSEQLAVPPRSASEEGYQSLWKAFYDALSCEQRFNPDLRRSFMPKRYWGNLTEMRRAVG